MRNLSNWRSVKLWESSIERQLRQRRTLWLHGFCIGTLVLCTMWTAAFLQMHLGVDSLAKRYLVTLGVGYLSYLLILRLWAGAMVSSKSSSADIGFDIPTPVGGHSVDANLSSIRLPSFESGCGGDFAGGGATGDFSGSSSVSDGLGDLASGAIEVAASSDEGAIVVVPVVTIFLIGCALLFGVGTLAMLYFGWDILLTVAVEIAFSYVSARTAIRVVREGWLSAAVRLSWKPLLGAMLCAVVLGATIDYFLPTAKSLPQAIKLIKGYLAASRQAGQMDLCCRSQLFIKSG